MPTHLGDDKKSWVLHKLLTAVQHYYFQLFFASLMFHLSHPIVTTALP